MSLRLQMQSDVLEGLIKGKFVALGFRGGASPEEGPVLIPGHLFPRDREDTADIDWEASSLRSAGHFFERIRVTKPQAPARPRKPRSQPLRPPLPPSAPPAPTSLASETSKKKGRRRVDQPIRAVVRSMLEAGQLQDKSRKEQIALIRAAARLARPDLFLRETQPSRDKIFSALRAEGLIGPRE